MANSPRPTVVIDDPGFRALVAAIVAEYRTVAPQVRDGSVVLAELTTPDDMCAGVTLEQAPGSCRVVPLAEGDDRRFAWAVGPHSAKSHQHPPEQVLFTAEVSSGQLSVHDPGAGSEMPGVDRPSAIIGLRPCDMAAVGVLDRVLGRGPVGGSDPFIVVVNCAEPGGTCFCASMGTGPELRGDRADSADIVLWERGHEGRLDYVVTHTSSRGARMLAGVDSRSASRLDGNWVQETQRESSERMGRRLDTDRLAERLVATLDSPRWGEVAQRCLSCGNCTMVCPTCFCSSVHDTSSLDGSEVTRTQRWDSCFSLEHSFVHGGSVRAGTPERYRQWLTHKLSTWWGQFGESGCVGCGRCISWCPVGIDLVEEANALAAEAALASVDPAEAEGQPVTVDGPGGGSRRLTEVLIRRRATAGASHRDDGGELP